MSIHTSFYHFEPSSNYASNGDGQSSNNSRVLCDTDVASMMLTLSSNAVYHFTQLYLANTVVAKATAITLVALDSDCAADATPTPISQTLAQTLTIATMPPETVMNFNPPIRQVYSSQANFVSVLLATPDSDTIPAMSFSGFTTPAP